MRRVAENRFGVRLLCCSVLLTGLSRHDAANSPDAQKKSLGKVYGDRSFFSAHKIKKNRKEICLSLPFHVYLKRTFSLCLRSSLQFINIFFHAPPIFRSLRSARDVRLYYHIIILPYNLIFHSVWKRTALNEYFDSLPIERREKKSQ